MNASNQHTENQAGVQATLEGSEVKGRYARISLDVPGAEVSVRLELGTWKQYSGSVFEMVPRGVKQGDHYRLLWVMAAGKGQIRMYTETQSALYLNGEHGMERWEAVDGPVEKVIGKSVSNAIPTSEGQ